MNSASLIIGVAVVASVSLATIGAVPPRPRLIWNASASVPVGLYHVIEIGKPTRNQLVVITPPKSLASFLVKRGYLPIGVPLIKHVAAVAGQRVCRVKSTIRIDGLPVGRALRRDHVGRPLPIWFGCIVLRRDQLFLLNSAHADSLDGRYFGALPLANVIGRAVPIWTRDND